MTNRNAGWLALWGWVAGCAPPPAADDGAMAPRGFTDNGLSENGPPAVVATRGETLWRKAPSVDHRGETPCGDGDPTPLLEVTELRVEGPDLIVDLVYTGTSDRDQRLPDASPVVELRVNGCASNARPIVRGSIRAAREAASSSVALPVASLPEGELQVSFVAFGLVANFMVANRGGRLRHIEERELSPPCQRT